MELSDEIKKKMYELYINDIDGRQSSTPYVEVSNRYTFEGFFWTTSVNREHFRRRALTLLRKQKIDKIKNKMI